jgi:hypothetical protein
MSRLRQSSCFFSNAEMRWFDEEKDPPPFLRALEEARRMATREG